MWSLRYVEKDSVNLTKFVATLISDYNVSSIPWKGIKRMEKADFLPVHLEIR